MYIVESKKIREQLEFRVKSLLAIGQEDIAMMIKDDVGKILQHEIFITVENNESIFADKINALKGKHL